MSSRLQFPALLSENTCCIQVVKSESGEYRRKVSAIHILLAAGTIPTTRTSRVANLITKRMSYRTSPHRVHTSMLKKSAAARTSECASRNSLQVVLLPRSGAGSIPAAFNTSQTVLRLISYEVGDTVTVFQQPRRISPVPADLCVAVRRTASEPAHS